MCNVYLVLAYGLLWCIFTFYAWMIQRRQQRLERELEELRRAPGPSDSFPVKGV
jgi:CcmD family protein